MATLYKELCAACNCYPAYVDAMDAFKSSPNFGSDECIPCTFTEHATCAAPIINNFEWTDRQHCPIDCESKTFRQTAVEVRSTVFDMDTVR